MSSTCVQFSNAVISIKTFLITLQILSVACLICKRMTDEEAARLFLYLQKMSREWSLLNNVTWGRVGAAVGDAAYGGYVIITIALLIGKLSGELPTAKRAAEITFLLIGATLFIILGKNIMLISINVITYKFWLADVVKF